ncbi:hypothetical protein FGB62_375g01 [Gracilaria domingensis]|nr:hypothetical protein FGB62_375g01 [Gracilaria domingensis]
MISDTRRVCGRCEAGEAAVTGVAPMDIPSFILGCPRGFSRAEADEAVLRMSPRDDRRPEPTTDSSRRCSAELWQATRTATISWANYKSAECRTTRRALHRRAPGVLKYRGECRPTDLSHSGAGDGRPHSSRVTVWINLQYYPANAFGVEKVKQSQPLGVPRRNIHTSGLEDKRPRATARVPPNADEDDPA